MGEGRCIYSVAMFQMNEPHFSNCFIEKRGSSYTESLVTRGFSLFVTPNLLFENQMTRILR